MKLFKKISVALGLMLVAVASASANTTVNITQAFEPIIDLIGVLVTNTSAFMGLVLIGVLLMVTKGIGAWIVNTLNNSMN